MKDGADEGVSISYKASVNDSVERMDIQSHASEASFAKPQEPTIVSTTAAAAEALTIKSVDRFDEPFYLNAHPDVSAAIARGDWQSGFMHYASIGYSKGRLACPQVDADWYMQTYPLCRVEIAGGLALDCEDHYFRMGRYRGYLPHATATRVDNPAALRSRFGGLWTDCANALDLVSGRLELGLVTDEQAEQLRTWITRGYVVLPQAIPENVLEAAANDLDSAYHGNMDGLRFAIHGVSANTAWKPEALTNPAKALDLHWHSVATRDLIFSPKVLDFLHLVFERRALASQTLGFWRGSQQQPHQDSAYVNYSIPMQFAASWIALEDVQEGAGELFYLEGSHRIAEYTFLGRFKGAEEAKRVGGDVLHVEAQINEHVQRISMQADGLQLNKGRFLARRGDALIWSADLAHGGMPISHDQTRKSIVTHYCPAECTPGYFEKSSCVRADYRGQAWFASAIYGRS